MKVPFYIVDAFTIPGHGFSGNQGAIVVSNSDDQISDETKQKIAAELNLSETAFVSRSWTSAGNQQSNVNELTLRWFTPTNEVDLCGHATLATSRAVFDTMKNVVSNNKITFDTRSKGKLIAELDASSGQISLDFPSAPPVPITIFEFPALNNLLHHLLSGLDGQFVDCVHYSKDTKKLLVCIKEQEDETLIRSINPNFTELINVKGNDNFVKGIIVTQVSKEDGIDFVSRYFAPWNGINEDPVTGSAHTVLMPFWNKYHPTKKGSRTLVGKQCSKRGGIIKCTLNGDRVYLAGSTEVVVEGTINV